ncbi:MAG TPA: hypothetical protein V6D48_20645 [Oculatellaceae cyanobacterium]
MKQTMNELSKAFSTGNALRLWLFFLLSFFFLGYSVYLSIFLGAVGGLAGGWVIGWWKSKDDPTDVQPEEMVDEEDLKANRARVRGLRLAKQHRDSKYSKESQAFGLRFNAFFGKKDNKISKRSARRANQQ